MSDREVTYTATVRVSNAAGSSVADATAYLSDLVVSLDIDRVPFAIVTATFKSPSSQVRVLTNPLVARPPRLQFRIEQRHPSTNAVIAVLPGSDLYAAAPLAFADLFVQEAEYDELTQELSIVAHGYESRLLDKLRIAGAPADQGAANVQALIETVVSDTMNPGGPVASIPTNLALSSVSLGAAGDDRRKAFPGESRWDTIEPEMLAAGARLFADLTGSWYVTTRDNPPRVAGASIVGTTHNADPSAGFPVTSLKERRARGDGFADGVLVRYTYIDSAGVSQTAYQASGGGANNKGIVIERKRKPPAANMADQIVNRALDRGVSYDVIGRCDFRARPGHPLQLDRPTATTSLGIIRAVEWRPYGDGQMVLRTQIGAPI